MKNKIISIVSALAMLCMLIPSPAAYAAGEGSVEITADNAVVERGGTVSYTISLKDVDSVRGIQVGLRYDEAQVEPVNFGFLNAADESASSALIKAEGGVASVAVAYAEPVNITGDIAVFEFSVKETAKSGALRFSLTNNGAVLTNAENAEIAVNTSITAAEIAYDYYPVIKAETDTTVAGRNGEAVYYVSADNLYNTRGFSAVMTYDDNIFELVSAEFTEGFNDNSLETVLKTDNGNRIEIAAAYEEPASVTGRFLKITFRVREDAPNGTYIPMELVRFDMAEGDEETVNADFTSDELVIASGSYIEMSYKADRSDARPGDRVIYNVSLDRIGGSRGFQAQLNYDSDALKLVSAEKGAVLNASDAFGGIEWNTDGIVKFICGYTTETFKTGDVAKLTFEVKENAPEGYVNMEAMDVLAVDSDYNYIDAETSNNIDTLYVGRLSKSYTMSLSPDKTAYFNGDTLYLNINLGQISDFLGVQFKLKFDASKLEYIAPERNSDYYGAIMKSATGKSINAVNAAVGVVEILTAFGEKSPYAGDGDLCTLAFKVKSDISEETELSATDIIPKTGDLVECRPVSVKLAGSREVGEVVGSIDSIPDVLTAEDSETVQRALDLYNSLTEDQKQDVTNYSELAEALDVLGVVNQIEDLGEITLDSKDDIERARAAYEALEHKDRVGNYPTLTAAEQKYAELEKEYNALPDYEYSNSVSGVTVSVTIRNNKGESTPTLITAQYNGQGELVSVNCEKVTINKGESAQYTYTKSEGTATVRCMLWQDINSMVPYGG